MADTKTVNPLSWNFNSFQYLIPTELRNGGVMPYSFSPNLFNPGTTAGTGSPSSQIMTNPFGNWSNIGMSGLFNNVGSLCAATDYFTQQSAPMIAQAQAYNNQMFNQNLAQAQQTAALRNQLMAQGINPNSVLGTGATGANSANNQMGALLSMFGLGGNTSSTNGLGSILGLLGGTSSSSSGLDSILGLLGLGGSSSSSGLGSLLSLFGLGGTTSNSSSTVDDWWNHTDPNSTDNSDESDSNDAFWNYIDSKVAQSRQQSQSDILLSLLGLQ